MIGHFSAEQLASYRAGAVSDGKAARIRSHLHGCTRCAQVDYDLGGLSELLASIPTPPMPDHLTERLRSALAAELAQRAVGATSMEALEAGLVTTDGLVTVGGSAPGGTPGRPDLPDRRRWRTRPWRLPDLSAPLLLRGLAATAVVVVLVGGGLLLANAGGGRLESTAAKPAGAGRAPRARLPASYNASGTQIQLQYQHDGKYSYTNAVATDANYTKANLPAGVRQELADTPSVSGVPAPSQASQAREHAHAPSPTLKKFDVGRLESCLSTVAAGRLVLLVEVARYAGIPAAIIVLRPVGGAFDVIVVGEGCGASGQDVITRLAVPRS